jgi:hypothetical protein
MIETFIFPDTIEESVFEEPLDNLFISKSRKSNSVLVLMRVINNG